MKKIMKINILTLSICLVQHAYALEQMSDQSLSSVTGQDGISISNELSKATIDQASWVDFTDTGAMRVGLKDVTIVGQNNNSVISQLDFDVGAVNQKPAIQINASIAPFKATVANVMLTCQTGCGDATSQSIGSAMVSTTTPISLNLVTAAGLFNRNDIAHLDFKLNNASLSYGLNGLNNELATLKDFNFNFNVDGYLYIDSKEGIVLTTKSTSGKDNIAYLGRVKDVSDVNSSRSNATNPGVNIDLRYGKEGEQKNLIRMGASGAVKNGKMFLNSDQKDLGRFEVSVSNNNSRPTEVAKSVDGYGISGVSGLHFGMSADFTREGDALLAGKSPTTFELGHTGNGSYAIEFANLTPLAVRDEFGNTNTRSAYLDLGDIYLNVARAQNLKFIVNQKLLGVLGTSSSLSAMENGSYGVYSYDISNGIRQNTALIAIRGMDFQSIARSGRFIADNSLAENISPTGTWGIGIPIYNLNANVALFSKKYKENQAGLGFNLVMSTEGYGIDSKRNSPSTTSIIVVDGKQGVHGEEANYYAGLRNIDTFLKADGVIGFESEGIAVKADHLTFAANAQLAIGQLPGSKYNCTTGSAKCGTYVSPDSFANKDDVLTNIAFKLDGKGEIMIIPGFNPSNNDTASNFLSVKANLEFQELATDQKNDQKFQGSYLSLVDENQQTVNGQVVNKPSSLNLNKLQGNIAAESRIYVKKDSVALDTQVKFNPQANGVNAFGKPFKAEMAMSPSGTMQKLGDIAITGGAMRSTIGIRPK